MSGSYKVCPRCQTPAPADAAQCASCGRVYRTTAPPPPVDQTQFFDAPPQATPAYNPTVAAGGPLDTTERSVSMVWTVIGLVATAAFFAASVAGTVRVFMVPVPEGDTLSGYVRLGSLVWLLMVGCLLSFLTMRLRRLYLAAPDGRPWADVAGRRARYAVGASLLLGLLLAGGIGWGVHGSIEDRKPTPLTITPPVSLPPPPLGYSVPQSPSTGGYIPPADYAPVQPYRLPDQSQGGAGPVPPRRPSQDF